MQTQIFISVKGFCKTFLPLFIFLVSYAFHSESIVYSKSCEFTTQLNDSEIKEAGYLLAGSRLFFKGGINLSSDSDPVNKKDYFGGFSAIEVSKDGTSMTAITDRGHFLFGKLEYDRDKLVAVKDAKWGDLTLDGDKYKLDTKKDKEFLNQVESVAIFDDGSL